MTVVPAMTVLSRLEVVCESIISSNGTLGNTVDTIGCVCMKLSKAMPMDCGSVLTEIIRDMHSLEGALISLHFKHLIY